MKSHISAPIPNAASVMALAAICVMLPLSSAQSQTGSTVPVTVDNFIRAESDLYPGLLERHDAHCILQRVNRRLLSGVQRTSRHVFISV